MVITHSRVTEILGCKSHFIRCCCSYSYRKGGQTIEKDVLLDDSSDPVWRLLRYEDMGTVIDSIDEGVRQSESIRRELVMQMLVGVSVQRTIAKGGHPGC